MLLLKIILHTCQTLAFVTAILKQPSNREGYQKHFVYFLGVTILVEILALSFRLWLEEQLLDRDHEVNNKVIYNPYILGSYLFLFYWYKKYLKTKIIHLVSLILAISFMVNSYYQNPFVNILDYMFYIGSILLLILTLAYFVQLLRSSHTIYFYKIQAFWIATGILIFYLGMLPLLFMMNEPNYDKVSLQFAIMILNAFMYILITVGLISPIKK